MSQRHLIAAVLAVSLVAAAAMSLQSLGGPASLFARDQGMHFTWPLHGVPQGADGADALPGDE